VHECTFEKTALREVRAEGCQTPITGKKKRTLRVLDMKPDSAISLIRGIIIVYFGIEVVYGLRIFDNRFDTAYGAHYDHIAIHH
jgi:hypothetical protein